MTGFNLFNQYEFNVPHTTYEPCDVSLKTGFVSGFLSHSCSLLKPRILDFVQQVSFQLVPRPKIPKLYIVNDVYSFCLNYLNFC
jgi:hypothetical protein